MASSINFTSLSNYWGKDALSQLDFINRLKSSLLDFQEYFDRQLSIVVQLNQEQEPTQAQWEQAWVAQAGRLLPIPSNAILLWKDTSGNTFGGQYITVNGRATVYNREPYYPKGAIIYNNIAYQTSSVTVANMLLTGSRESLPSLNFTINQDFDLVLGFQAWVGSSAGNQSALEFELNGTKVGTAYYGLPGTMGSFQVGRYSTDMAFCEIPIFNLPVGTYTAQVLYAQGEQNEAVTYTFGGTTYGMRMLTVKAYSR